jgi:iron complex transport system substrate-binding protein|tara:strand:+ start:356 stop:1219 length:864 start_codon:yes stop_codon:yes gene_type:complete
MRPKFLNVIISLPLILNGSQISANTFENHSTMLSEKDKSITRIVSLTSLSTDIIYHLSPESLKGRPDSSLFLKRKEFNNIPIVSKGRTPPNLELIISLKPDLVIGAKGFHDKSLNALNEIGIKTLSTQLKDWSDLESIINELKLVTNSKKTNLNDKLYNCINGTDAKGNEVVVLVSTKPLLAPNSQSWAGSLLSRFNIKNLTSKIESSGRLKGYVNLSPEWLIDKNPDKLILIEFNNDDLSKFYKLPFWKDLNAVKNNNISNFNYYGLINAGSLETINNACKQLKSI